MVKFICRYLTLYDAIVYRIVSLISLSDSLFLVYRNTTDFCILIFYPVTLLTSFISSNSFLMQSLGFSIYIVSCDLQIMGFTSFFLIWMNFISFSCLVALDKTSKTMLYKRGESGHPYFVSDLRGEAFSFLLLSMMFVSCGFIISSVQLLCHV